MFLALIFMTAIGLMTAFNDPNSCKEWPRDAIEVVNIGKPLACKWIAPEGRKCDCPIEFVQDPPYGECPKRWTEKDDSGNYIVKECE